MAVSPHPRFTTAKREQYYTVQYNHEFSRAVETNLAPQINDTQYAKVCSARAVLAQDAMWRCVLHLQKILDVDDRGNELSPFRATKMAQCMQCNFDALEWRQSISRPNFVACVLKALEDNGCQADRKARGIIPCLHSVFHSSTAFDTLGQGRLDWRAFVCYLRVARNPHVQVQHHLCSYFRDIGGTVDCLKQTLYPFVKASRLEEMLSALGNLWALVAFDCDDDDGSGKARFPATRMPFERMIAHPKLAHLFEQSCTLEWGRGKTFPVFVSKWEHELYNQPLLDLVRSSRRSRSITVKLHRDCTRIKRQVTQNWLRRAKYDALQRRVYMGMQQLMVQKRTERAFGAFVGCKRRHSAALDVQRVLRGHFGRLVAWNRRKIYRSATRIQTRWRIFLARQELRGLSFRYNKAIVTVQSHVRGAIGRRLALNKLTFLLYQQRTANEQERQRIALEHGIWALTKLQSGWRRILSVRIAARLRQQVRRELAIQTAMKTQRSNFLRERKIYKRQLTDWYESMKADHDRKILEKNRINQERVKIRTLQRCTKNEENKNAPPDRSEELADARWEREQLAEIRSKVEWYRYHLGECLDKPDNRAERKTRSLIRKRIKERLRVVLKRADESNIIMETPQVRRETNA